VEYSSYLKGYTW